MKTIPLIFLSAAVSAAPAFSQIDKPAVTPAESSASSARTSFPNALEVLPFTPPASVERKRLPDIRIDSSVTVPGLSSHTVTLQRGEASTVPDPPPPTEAAAAVPARKLTPEELARLANQRQHFINLGATVDDHKISKVQWTAQESGEIYQAICGFDISLLAGIGSFVHDGESYQLLLILSPGDAKALGKPDAKKPARAPGVAEGKILITEGNPNDTKATFPVRLIQEILTSEKDRLIAYQAARLKYQQESAAWAAAHPPVPQDLTFVFRPRRGSRYLTNPQPEPKEGAR